MNEAQLSEHETDQEKRIAALESQVQQLSSELRDIKALIVGHPASVQRGQFSDPKISTVVQLTEELFAGSRIEVETEVDPSEPDRPFVVFKVSCSGELDELLAREMEWNRRVREADSGYSGQLGLLVSPTE